MTTTAMNARPVVVGIPPQAEPGRALRWAAEEALRRAAPLRLVQANDTPAAVPMLGVRGPFGTNAAIRRHLDRLLGWVGREYPGLPVAAESRIGSPVDVLSVAAADAALVVVGRREQGRLAQAVFGSTATNLSDVAGCPVVAVPEDAAAAPVDGPVLVGVKDDVREAFPAIRFALAAAGSARVPLHVFHYRGAAGGEYGDDPTLPVGLAACGRDHPDVPAHLFVLDGDPAELLPREARQASLLVLAATRGRHHSRLGRVGNTVLRHAACPVALVPTSYAQQEPGAGTRTPLRTGREMWPDIPVI